MRWLLWLAAVVFFLALALFPVSYRITRLTSVALGLAVWFGLIGLLWKQKLLRFSLLVLTLLANGLLMMPSRTNPPADVLRAKYISALKRYEGVPYYWGGETARGIDCSGLIRKGLIDALLSCGISTHDAGLVRQAISLWWHDCTASALGDEHRGLTTRVVDTPSVNVLDHARILPGDLAVTQSGVHIMAFLGNDLWIEADPDAGKVITLTAPAPGNGWFQVPMNIVRWSILK